LKGRLSGLFFPVFFFEIGVLFLAVAVPAQLQTGADKGDEGTQYDVKRYLPPHERLGEENADATIKHRKDDQKDKKNLRNSY